MKLVSFMKKFITLKVLRIGFLAFFLLAGCQTELFSKVSENEANEMVALLLKNGIDAEKVMGKKDIATVWVDKSEIAPAIQILKESGYPKEQFGNLGTVFTKEGLISSPLEERARYVYAVSQELSETLTNLDGVLTARVHVVFPDTDKTGALQTPASAAVFIKYTEGANLQAYIPQIKLLVNNSIEGLSYEKISVVLFPAHRVQENSTSMRNAIAMGAQSSYLFIGLLIVIGVLSVGAVVFFILKKK